MKLETYLNAIELTREDWLFNPKYENVARRTRQNEAFRARILRMDEEKDAKIAELDKWIKENAWLVHVHMGVKKND